MKIIKFRDLRISAQLIIGFAITLVFVLTLGIISTRQSDKIHNQTLQMYQHPLKVRRALGKLNNDIMSIRVITRDLMLSEYQKESKDGILELAVYEADALNQLDSIRLYYLGPKKDIDEANQALIKWTSAYNENNKLFASGQHVQAINNLSTTGAIGILRTKMLKEINDIDSFANNKSDEFFQQSIKLKSTLDTKLLLLIIFIIALMLLISFILIRNIRNPIKELIRATLEFKNGNLNVRTSIDSKNEYGELSNSFNSMVESIQNNVELSDKSSNFAQLMLSAEDPKKFFTSILPAMAANTNSQMAAIYLLSDDKKRYEHLESFGMVDEAHQSFGVDNLEGEFAPVLASRKIHLVKRIPKDTRFVFHTVSGKIVPREIMSIPIISGNAIIAIISLASVRKYSEQSIQFINNSLYTLSARFEGVLAFQKIQISRQKLEFQNSELEAQKTEMSIQSVELKEQNRELEVQKTQLSEANRLKTNFLSNMSHELRTPLNSVIALSGVLSRRLANKIPTDEFSYLEVIERNGKHLLSLINDILDISRIEAGREEVEISRFSTENIIEEVVSMILPQAKQKNIQLIQPENNKNIFITSDINKLRHILQNLISNAVKFTEKGKVEIIATQHKESIEISVTDTGIGIDAEHINHIFDEFRQADASTSRRFGGTGLGLSIAKKYANLLGGTITVKSTPEAGSTFTLTIPINYSPENALMDDTYIEQSSRFKVTPTPINKNPEKTILLVDDSDPAIIQMKDFMTESGYKILTASNGSEALDIISQVIPDAMVLDLMMPGIDGFSVLESIRNAEATANIPVLILTAKHITKEDLKFLKRNNIHQLIQKGDVNRTELLEAVAGLVYTDEKPEIVNPRTNPQIIKGKPNILIVEDNVDNMTTVKAILSERFNVIEAIDGSEGVLMAKKYIPHLILMDIALPGMDGIAAFQAIRQNGELEHIPIIALTASAMTSDRETILSHGFDAYIAKPIDQKDFFDTINKVLFGK